MTSSGMKKAKSPRDSSIIVMVTCPEIDTAEKIASSLTAKKLAACVNITQDVKSVYRWMGKIVEGSERLLIVKSKQSLLSKIIQDVKLNHPYQVPEIVALPIIGGSKEYFDWLTKETS